MSLVSTLNFGTAGIPLSAPKRDTINGIPFIKTLNLDSLELEFVRSVNITEEKAPLIKQIAKQHNVLLTCHGQYFINLNSSDEKVLRESAQRILLAAQRAHECGAWSICYHLAYYSGQNPSLVYEKVKQQLNTITKQLKDNNNPIWLRPETGGKINQFADIDDLIKISQDVEQVLPCIDWAHHYARTLGKTNSYPQFAEILTKIETKLGKHALQNMHMHLEGIEFTDKGEKNHINARDCPLKYQEILKALKEFNVKGALTCESPNIESDAILYKKTYEKI
ncbi:TIM barrel protein [Candidatus Woesearchaeota archaeon]|nr:TIM barrel protein [Candidatus Woesearchaeota archaeon]